MRRVPGPAVRAAADPVVRGPRPLSPRERQTLDRLLAGDGEKQVAARLGVSVHTVHVYVKRVYRWRGVHSRGELLASFIDRDPLPGSAGG